MNRHTHLGAQLLAEFFNVFAFLPDNNAGARCMNDDARCLSWTLDHNATDRGCVELLQHVVPNLKIADEIFRVVFAIRIPHRIVVFDHTQANTGWMYLLTHASVPLAFAVRNFHSDVTSSLEYSITTALGARAHALHG